ncbi:MAG: cell division inhibitor [Flavobacteriales bacterium]|nr:cell division inhibitor [Flavobacteriales bacterium]
MYQYISTQELNISKDKAWEFLSNPKNLKDITPPYMGFNIISGHDRKMYQGQIIQYILTPVLKIPFRWVTEITHVVEEEYFVDEQRFGPFVFWHHKHFIHSSVNGVVMKDIVDYKLPFGVIGKLVHFLFIKKRVNQIFDFRKKKLNTLFNN